MRPDATVAQEEIFGPVLVILPYGDVDEAVAIANGTPYGLAGARVRARRGDGGGVRPAHEGRPDRHQRRPVQPAGPFGGFKRSGIGREFGAHGLGEFLEYKSLQL